MTGSNSTPIYGIPYPNRDTDQLEYEDISGERAYGAIETVLARLDTASVIQVFTAGADWTMPDNAKVVRVRCWGGGAGGGGITAAAGGQNTKASGGGSGGYSESILPASTLATTVAITVGAAGTAGTSGGGTGGTGGTSSFGTHVIALGGVGGVACASSPTAFGAPGGAGAAPGTGQITDAGHPGANCWGDTTLAMSGGGGGPGGGPGLATNGSPQSAAGISATGRGAGGGGAVASAGGAAQAGGAGAAGRVVVETYF